MKQIITALFFTFLGVANAQNCNIDYSQTQVGLYPATLIQGIVGTPYSQDITFVLPTDTMGYAFTNFQILSIGLPVGLNWTCNNSQNNCNYNPQLSQFGCVQIDGTPLLAGNYTVEITVLADLTILSGYPFVFQLELEILPNTNNISNNGFSFNGTSSCSPTLIDFTNNNPGLSGYFWDFGNGNFSFEENPSPQYYLYPGAYVVAYAAFETLDTIQLYTLTNFAISNLSNYGGGFPSFENADAYFKVFKNGQLYYQSSILGDQNPPLQWNLNLTLDPAQSYVIEIWEADESYGEPYLGADDFMGSHNLNLYGCDACSASNSNFGYTVHQQFIFPSPQIIASDTILIFGPPETPFISYDSLNHVLNTLDSNYNYQWYLNGAPLAGATEPNYIIYQSGLYYLAAVNTAGCVVFSDTINLIFDVGITEPDQKLPKIYPNPNNGLFHIDFTPEWIGANYYLKDLHGKIVIQGQLFENEQIIDLKEIQKGIYLLVIQNKTQSHFLRIIINA